jgi:hypothetical protein
VRWRFVDENNAAELEHRRSTIERIDKFWGWFERSFGQSGELVMSPDNYRCARSVSQELSKVHKALGWELSPKVNDERRFVVTPEASHFLHPMVETMLERAPKMPDFRFMACREPVEPECVESAVTGRAGRWIPDIRIEAKITEHNSIDLTFVSNEFRGQNNKKDLLYCFVLCEVVFGQSVLEQWIGELQTWSMKPGLLKRMRSFIGLPSVEGSAGNASDKETCGLIELREEVDRLKQEILSKLPGRPFWQQDPEQVSRTLLTFEGAPTGRLTCATMAHQVFQGLIGLPRCFSCERFSRFGETFCYLKIDESATVVTNETPDRGELEEAFDLALKKASVGCVTGGGWGPVYNFIDLALVDLDAAIPVLQTVSSELNLPKATWLRFLDTKLSQEWVGMYHDTPVADMSPGW